MTERSSDSARKYCKPIRNVSNHVECIFCGHPIWGITRFKEHLARRRGDVKPCRLCPDEISLQMKEEIEELDHRREEREKRIRLESSSSSSFVTSQLMANPAPTQDGNQQQSSMNESEDNALMEQVIQESLRTFEKEKNRAQKIAEKNDEELKKALHESMNSYRKEAFEKKYKPLVENYNGDTEDEIEVALRQSMQTYKEELERRVSRAGTSYVDSDSDSLDIDFGREESSD